MLRLWMGHKPGRPESRTLNDSHWNLIQDCWSQMEERPAAEAIIYSIQQFLAYCPQPPPLCYLLQSSSGRAHLSAESSSSLSHGPAKGSSPHGVFPDGDKGISGLSAEDADKHRDALFVDERRIRFVPCSEGKLLSAYGTIGRSLNPQTRVWI